MRLLCDIQSAFRVAAVLVLGVALSACSTGTDRDSSSVPEGSSSAAEVAPDFSLPDLDGNTVRLSDFDGQVKLLDFWATWCAPCREEVPMFKELHEKYGAEGFALVAISMDDEGADVVRPFVEELGIPYTNLIGDAEVEEAFGPIVGYPMAFLVDRDGKIVKTFVGAKPRKVLEGKIQELLGAGA